MGAGTRILSVDGGGSLGLASAMVLIELERRTRRPTAELFDLVAGTSVGGLLGLSLLIPGADGAPRHTGAQIASLFEKDADQLFESSLWRWLSTLGGFLGEKYETTGLQEVLDQVFGDAWLSEAIRPTLIPAYDLLQDEPCAFRLHRAQTDAGTDSPASAVVRATTAVPGFCPPARIESRDRLVERLCIDGGAVAFNPALWAYAEALRLHPEADDVVLASPGTIRRHHGPNHVPPRGRGAFEWARPLFQITCDAASAVTHEQLQDLIGARAGGPEHYFRLRAEVELPGAGSLDDTSAQHLERVRAAGAELLEREDERIDRLCARLTREQPATGPDTGCGLTPGHRVPSRRRCGIHGRVGQGVRGQTTVPGAYLPGSCSVPVVR